MLGPSASAGNAKVMVWPMMKGYEWRTNSVGMFRMTSASTKKLAVSDQFKAEIVTLRSGRGRVSGWMLVNGQGPAMHETRRLRNSFRSWASSDSEPVAAFHLPSGEQGRYSWQGTLPVLKTSNCRATLPR